MTGCKDSFFLIARNVFRVGAIHVIGGLAMFTGKVFVIAATVGASFFYLDRAFSKELNGIVGTYVYTCKYIHICTYNIAYSLLV